VGFFAAGFPGVEPCPPSAFANLRPDRGGRNELLRLATAKCYPSREGSGAVALSKSHPAPAEQVLSGPQEEQVSPSPECNPLDGVL
jgi:hypothetical protein